jgi:hypothetical protein
LLIFVLAILLYFGTISRKFGEDDSFDEFLEEVGHKKRQSSFFGLPVKGKQVVKLLNALSGNDYFGAVHGEHTFPGSHQAKSFCEILFLSKTSFESVSRIHLSMDNVSSFLASIGDDVDNVNGGETTASLSDGADLGKAHPSWNNKRRGALGITIATNTVAVDNTSWTSAFLGLDCMPRRVWNIVTAVCILYYMFSCPVLLSQSLYKHFVRDNLEILTLAWIADGIVFVDLLLQWHAFPFIKEGVVMSKQRDIADNFTRNNNAYLEIITVIPFDLLAITIGPNFIPVLRMVKLYRVINVWKYLDKIKGMSTASGLNRLLFLVFLLYMVIHWFGCAFVLAARASSQVIVLTLKAFLLNTVCRYSAMKSTG